MDVIARFRVGDKVEVQTPISYEGTGQVVEISNKWSPGFGTKLYPAFLVRFDDGGESWFNGISLTKV